MHKLHYLHLSSIPLRFSPLLSIGIGVVNKNDGDDDTRFANKNARFRKG